MVTNASSLGVMDKMNPKSVVLNAAFAVLASFVISDHLAFTIVFDPDYAGPMIVTKLVSGIFAVIWTLNIYKGDSIKSA